MSRLKGKVAVVTGASKGIGAAITGHQAEVSTKELFANGWRGKLLSDESVSPTILRRRRLFLPAMMLAGSPAKSSSPLAAEERKFWSDIRLAHSNE